MFYRTADSTVKFLRTFIKPTVCFAKGTTYNKEEVISFAAAVSLHLWESCDKKKPLLKGQIILSATSLFILE